MQAIKLEYRKLQSMHVAHNIIHLHACDPILYLAYDMGLQCLTFTRRNANSMKKLTPIKPINNDDMNNVGISMNNVA